jgi:hypothetical protein
MDGLQQFANQNDGTLRQYEYDDSTIFAADLGTTDETSVDLVDQTAIVVVGDDQFEFEVPTENGDAQTDINNGILTIEVKA